VSKSTLNQEQWIQFIFEQCPIFAIDPIEQMLGTSPRAIVFFNPINHDSMRLTREGFVLLKQLKLKYYDFKLLSAILPRQLLQLERHIHHPYFVHNLSKISIFDEASAIMLQLHGGDLATYLKNLDQTQ
jgi:hypothetical protein